MSIRTLSSDEPYPGVVISLVEITDPGEDVRTVFEVTCEECDSFDSGLTLIEALEALVEHRHNIEKGRE
jgi:hypothetical protein